MLINIAHERECLTLTLSDGQKIRLVPNEIEWLKHEITGNADGSTQPDFLTRGVGSNFVDALRRSHATNSTLGSDSINKQSTGATASTPMQDEVLKKLEQEQSRSTDPMRDALAFVLRVDHHGPQVVLSSGRNVSYIDPDTARLIAKLIETYAAIADRHPIEVL